MTDQPKTQYIVIDRFGGPWGPFDDPATASRWAAKKWPDQKQKDSGFDDGWDIAVLHSTDE